MFFARKKRDAAVKETIDQLGAVRDALRVLRVREEALLTDLEAYRPPDNLRAARYDLEIRKKTVRRFETAALPQHIYKDPAYWVSETKKTVILTPLDSTQQTPTAEQIADTYAETYDLPIGVPEEAATYGSPAMPDELPPPATPLLGPHDENAASPETPRPSVPSPASQALAAAEPAQGFDFSGVPRYRTGGKTALKQRGLPQSPEARDQNMK